MLVATDLILVLLSVPSFILNQQQIFLWLLIKTSVDLCLILTFPAIHKSQRHSRSSAFNLWQIIFFSVQTEKHTGQKLTDWTNRASASSCSSRFAILLSSACIAALVRDFSCASASDNLACSSLFCRSSMERSVSIFWEFERSDASSAVSWSACSTQRFSHDRHINTSSNNTFVHSFAHHSLANDVFANYHFAKMFHIYYLLLHFKSVYICSWLLSVKKLTSAMCRSSQFIWTSWTSGL